MCLDCINDQPATPRIDIVTEHWVAASPLAFAPCRRHLVASPLRYHLALELREREEDVERQASERIRRIELLRHGNEAHFVTLQSFNDPGKVDQRSAQPVYVDH